MAAIADLTVESTAPTVVEVDWTDNGETNLLKRAPYGGAYSTLATVTGLATYSDTTAVTETRYQYKINSGVSGDSNVDDVVAQTCAADSNEPEELTLPAFQGDTQQDDLLNQMARDLESFVNVRLAGADPCEICPSSGAITIDCSRCTDFNVAVTEDINSISMVNCDGGGDGTMNFKVPPNVTRCICGFPQTFGFEGGECFTGCVPGGSGAAGKTFPVGFTRTPNGPQAKPFPLGSPTAGGGGGGAGAGCVCSPTTPGQLTLKCCTTDCSIACASTKSLKLYACGGMSFTVGKAYTWAVTGSLSMVISKDGRSATITPPTNSGSAVAGDAYNKYVKAGSGADQAFVEVHKCDDSVQTACAQVGIDNFCPFGLGVTCAGVAGVLECESTPIGGSIGTIPNASSGTNCVTGPVSFSTNYTCDVRTAPMIAAGCSPCGIAADGKVVTVTDALGVSVSQTLNS